MKHNTNAVNVFALNPLKKHKHTNITIEKSELYNLFSEVSLLRKISYNRKYTALFSNTFAANNPGSPNKKLTKYENKQTNIRWFVNGKSE